MPELERLIEAVVRTAERWRDPEHPPRKTAVDRTLKASDSFTAEAIAFAVNQQMALLTVDSLYAWAPGHPAETARMVGVLNAGNVPLVELQDLLAVLLAGHRYLGTVSSRSPYLVPAFARDLAQAATDISIEFVDSDELFAKADAVIATGSDETAAWVDEQCEASGIAREYRLIRGHRFSIAVIDGRESADELEQLAEDVLLHEGFGCRNVAVLWAPKGQSPDDLLSSFANFRGVFPAHEATPGRIKMQRAFLEALDVPHAYGDGLEFLMSKGDPEPQKPGHLRWSEYSSLAEVEKWLGEHRDEVQIVVARPGLQERLDLVIPLVAPGDAQRPPLDWWPDGTNVMTFLSGLDRFQAGVSSK